MSPTLLRTMTEVAGEGVACLESPGSGPDLLLCHSNSTSAELYRPLLEGPLGARCHAVAVDFPGHGRSAFSQRGSDAYSLPALARGLAELVARRRLERYVLVGHSLGGHAILEALDALPGARGVFLISAPPIQPTNLAQVFQPDPSEGLLFKSALESAEVDRFARALLRPGVAPRASEAAMREAIAATDPAFRSVLGSSLAAGLLGDEIASAARSSVPMALSFGTDDPIIRSNAYRAVELRNPWRGGAFPFGGQGHSPHLTAPVEFSELLGAFIDECAGSG
ncbi:MAG: alpha/beta hydrolase [Polyangiaceae bacterium]